METFKSTLHALFFFACLLQTASSVAGTPNEINNSAGSIIFTYDNNQSSCRVDDRQQMFEVSYYAGGPGIRPCEPNKISYLRLEGVRSAATIKLWSYLRSGEPSGCHFDDTHNFTLFFRTLKNTTTTRDIRLDALFDVAEGTVIQPGIRLIKKDITEKDRINKKLSCVEIIYE